MWVHWRRCFRSWNYQKGKGDPPDSHSDTWISVDMYSILSTWCDCKIVRFEKDAAKYWDIFYKCNGNRFYKDRYFCWQLRILKSIDIIWILSFQSLISAIQAQYAIDLSLINWLEWSILLAWSRLRCWKCFFPIIWNIS